MRFDIKLKDIAKKITIDELEHLIFLKIEENILTIDEFADKLKLDKEIYDFSKIIYDHKFIAYVIALYINGNTMIADKEMKLKWNNLLKELDFYRWNRHGRAELSRPLYNIVMKSNNIDKDTYDYKMIQDFILFTKFPNLKLERKNDK